APLDWKTYLQNDSASFTIEKSVLGQGINRLTLFDAAGKPVCERVYGIRPSRELTIEASTDQPVYGTRKKVQLSVSASEEAIAGSAATATAGSGATTVPASLSMAVYRDDSLPAPEA